MINSETKKVEKSINIVIAETKDNLMQVIVKSQLPASITEMAMKEVFENISIQSKQILEQEKIQYQKLLQEQNKKEGEKNGFKK